MAETAHPEQVFHGTPVSRGIAFGPAHVSARGFSAPDVYPIQPEAVPFEKSRFEAAVARTKTQLAELRDRIGDPEAVSTLPLPSTGGRHP